MGTTTDTQIALDTRLNALGLSETIIYENTRVTPVAGTVYITTQVNSDPSTLAKVSGGQLNSGEYVLSIYTELEKGPGAYNTLADSIVDHFKGQDILVQGSTEVWITACSRATPVRDEQMLLGIVGIAYSVFTN